MRINFAERTQGKPLIDTLNVDYTDTELTLFRYLPDLEKDFIDVAMAAYVADRVTPRSPEHPHHWVTAMTGRELELFVPVRIPEVWEQDRVRRALETTLSYMTGDVWNINFCPREGDPVQSNPELLRFEVPLRNPFVGLFSGGLDSYAGVVNHVLEPGFDTGILVAAHSTGNLLSRQRTLVTDTNARLASGKHLTQLSLRHDLKRQAAEFVQRKQHTGYFRYEKTQRSRGFLFLTLGLAIARTLNLDTLYVYENGFGAINLPQTSSGLGVDYTRAMNPIAFGLMSNFTREVFGSALRIENRSLWKTKGHMCKELQTHGFSDIAVMTITCDRFPRQGKPKEKEQCGLCTSCLLRRISLAAAGLVAPDKESSRYEWDVFDIAPTEKNFHDLAPLRAMKTQASRLSEALMREGEQEQAKALIRAFPELHRVRVTISQLENRPLAEVTGDLVRLFKRYLDEWDIFSFMLPEAATPERAAYGGG